MMIGQTSKLKYPLIFGEESPTTMAESLIPRVI